MEINQKMKNIEKIAKSLHDYMEDKSKLSVKDWWIQLAIYVEHREVKARIDSLSKMIPKIEEIEGRFSADPIKEEIESLIIDLRTF